MVNSGCYGIRCLIISCERIVFFLRSFRRIKTSHPLCFRSIYTIMAFVIWSKMTTRPAIPANFLYLRFIGGKIISLVYLLKYLLATTTNRWVLGTLPD